jgi:hypothetical protein
MFRGSEPISDDEWRNYWSPGGPTAMPSLIAMRAVAALKVIREPSEEMIVAMLDRIPDGEDPGKYSYVWYGMIDAALEKDQ